MSRPSPSISTRIPLRAVLRVQAACLLAASLLAGTLLAAVAATAKPPPYEADPNASRDDVPGAYKWNLDPLFPSDAAWEEGLAKVGAMGAGVAAHKGKLGTPAELLACLKGYFAARLGANRVTLYANLRFDSHTDSSAQKGMNDRALGAYNDFMAATAFMRTEVLALSDQALAAAYAAEPGLTAYRVYLDGIRRRRKTVLGEEAERVLNLAGDNIWAELDLNELPSDHEKSFEALLGDMPLPEIEGEKGEPVKLTLGSYPRYRGSADRRVRKEAMEALFSTLGRYRNVLAATLGGQVRLNVFYARSRGYETALEAYLDRDDIRPAVYHNLVRTIGANTAPLHRYMALRKKLMKVDELRVHDLYAPMIPAADMKVPYDAAPGILFEALRPLGKSYVDAVRAGLDPKNGWMDPFPHKNKQSGAFSASVFGVHPFVKLNYMGTYDDLSTLAHELGHAIHSKLAMEAQPYQDSSYVPFVAEIASTTNEILLVHHMLEKARSKDEKLALLGNLLESIRLTIYRQVLFAEYELALHTAAEKGEPLTADLLHDTYRKLLQAYYGPDFVLSEHDGWEWGYIPHFYYKYYVFTYATGLAAGIALAERVRAKGPEARDAYLAMLRGGCSKPPLDLLRDAGVDMTRPETIEASTRLMDSTIARMEEILVR